MAEGTRATGWAKFVKEKVNLRGSQALSTWACSGMTSDPVKVFSLIPRKDFAVLSMRGLGQMTRETVKAHTISPMVANMWAISRMISLVDREN